MPLGIDFRLSFAAHTSTPVISVDFHPTEPWVVSGCCDGSLFIWDYKKGVDIKHTDGAPFVEVWSAKFVARKQWVVTGTEESFIRVYGYHDTSKLLMDEIRAFKAHSGPINCVAVHPTLPYVLSASDDKLINLWNWEQDWLCMQTFTSHTYFVMYVAFNPKDTNTFATASLDKTVKIWNLEDPKPISTFDAHQSSGVNCLDFYPGEEDKPYLITGSDDYTAKVWNYQTSKCVMTLEGHTNSVRAVCFHPTLPIIITGSDDKTLRIWHATTFRLENTVDLRIHVHAIGHRKGSCRILYGCDHGPGMVKLMHELPVASMGNQGNVILAKHNDIHSGIIKLISGTDGILDINGKLGTCSFYPESLKHSPDGCFVAVLGNCEYIIYDACTWEKILSGSALEFVWSSEGEYAVKVSSSQMKIFSNKFQETGGLAFSAEYIFDGTLLGMCTNDSVFFFDWAKCRFISKIDFPVKNLYWANSGDRVAIVSDSSFKIFKFDRESVSSYLDGGKTIGEKGIVGAFEILSETKECVRSGLWVMDCFIYYAASWKLKYCVGCEVTTMDWLRGPWSVLCYLSDRVCLIDNKFKITTYTLPLSLIKFKTCIVRGDREQARSIFHTIPEEHRSRACPEKIIEFKEKMEVKKKKPKPKQKQPKLKQKETSSPTKSSSIIELSLELQHLDLNSTSVVTSTVEEVEPMWKVTLGGALSQQIEKLRLGFHSCSFEVEQLCSNPVAWEIAKSVTRDGSFQSYLVLRGPSSLQDRIANDASRGHLLFLFILGLRCLGTLFF